MARPGFWDGDLSLCGIDGREVRAAAVKTTRYFEEQVLRKRPYITRDWCVEVVASPLRREVQADGRIRHWGKILRPGDPEPRFLRVVTLDDGETIHNAFFDRAFRKDEG